jgi:hypothetical protein
MSSPTLSASLDQDYSGQSLTWRTHALRDHPEMIGGLVASFGCVIAAAWITFHSLIVGAAASAALAGALKEYIAPLDYRLDDHGVSVRCGPIAWIEMPWEQVRSIYRTSAGLKLSPFPNPKVALTEQLRGVTLRFPRERAAMVEDFARQQADGARWI